MSNIPQPELLKRSLEFSKRYIKEVIQLFGLCPYAREEQLARKFFLGNSLDFSDIIEKITELDSDNFEIALFVFPEITLSKTEFESSVRELIAQDSKSRPGHSPPFAMAAFHPHMQGLGDSPEKLVQALRRSPDPTIQLVRVSVLEKLRSGEEESTTFIDPMMIDWNAFKRPSKPSLRQKIAQKNFDTILEQRHAYESSLEKLIQDRYESYLSLGFESLKPLGKAVIDRTEKD